MIQWTMWHLFIQVPVAWNDGLRENSKRDKRRGRGGVRRFAIRINVVLLGNIYKTLQR